MTSVTPFFFVGWIPITVGDLDAAKTIDQQLLPNVGERERGEGQKDKNTMIAKQRQWLYLQSSVVEISWECFLRNCCILLGDFICNTPLRHNGIFTLIYIFAIHSDHSIWTLDSWNKHWLFLAESRSMARQSIPKIGCRTQMCNFLSHCNKHAEIVMIVCSFCSRRNSLPMVKFVRICKIHFFFFCGSLNTHFLYGCYTRATCHKSKVPGLGMMRWEARVVGWAHFVPIWESQVYVAKIECVFCLFIVQVACS